MLAAALNAFFCASPIYGSAEDFTSLLNFTPCEGLTPAAKQQIGETRKKCNSDDRRLRRIQGGAVGAAASRMRAVAKQTLGAATRRFQRVEIAGAFLVLFWHAKENLASRNRALPPRHKRENQPNIVLS